MEFLLAGENVAFSAALALMLALALLEAVGMVFGASISHAMDSVLPDLGLDVDADIHADTGADGVEGVGALSGFLSWLCIGRAPLLVLLVAFLFSFGVGGLVLQSAAQRVMGSYLPGWLAAIPALAVALPAVRFFGLGVSRILPKEETYAVSADSFVGRTAVITVGIAAAGQPAEARLTDQHGRTHYVRVEPQRPDDTFPAGTAVRLLSREGIIFRVVGA